MSTAIATIRPNANPIEHHGAWAGSAARKVRTAEAANAYDLNTLWSLCVAMLHESEPSPHTLKAYRLGVTAYVEWAEEHGINLLRPEHGTGTRYRTFLIDSRGGKDRANAGTINVRIAGARVLYRAFDWADVTASNPFSNVKAMKEKRAPEAIRDAYSVVEVARLLEACDDPHDRAVVLLGSSAGLRAAEMIALEWDGDNGTRVVLPERTPAGEWSDAGALHVLGKGGTLRVVPIGDEVMDALEALPHRAGPVLAHVRSTSGLRYRVARLAQRAGMIDKARPPKGSPKRSTTLGLHRLRHRFGTDVVQQLGLEGGRVALRHASVQTTVRYVKTDQARIADYMRTLRRS